VDLGRKLWVEPAGPVINRYRQYFQGGRMVYFEDKAAVNRFVNEPDFVPVVALDTVL
jgi:hypothetical protein